MGRRQKQRAKERRIELMMVLGYCCAHCGSEEKLEFDCIVPRGHAHHRMDTSARMCFYWREHLQHRNIQILCASCNTKKSANEQPNQDEGDPF